MRCVPTYSQNGFKYFIFFYGSVQGSFFLIYGLALAFWEIKNDLPLFWGAGRSLFNIGAINSSMIIGASIFFFASNGVHGICAFGIEIALYALISVFEWK